MKIKVGQISPEQIIEDKNRHYKVLQVDVVTNCGRERALRREMVAINIVVRAVPSGARMVLAYFPNDSVELCDVEERDFLLLSADENDLFLIDENNGHENFSLARCLLDDDSNIDLEESGYFWGHITVLYVDDKPMLIKLPRKS